MRAPVLTTESVEISFKGRLRHVPGASIDGRTIIVRGKWVKTAAVHDELYLPHGIVTDPASVIAQLKTWEVRPDIFEFVQRVTEPDPKYPYPFEWDNLAVLPITDYATWLTKDAKRDVKENLRRARREGVVVESCPHDDELVRGLKRLYDETPLRQGRPFWHHGKSEEAIKRESGHYADRSEFIAAFHEGGLIGFMKMVYVGEIAKTMYVISSERHFHLRPANAMIAKAVELCAARGIKHLNYGVYEYPGKRQSSLTEFKTRHGFVRRDYPRYFVPLTPKGRLYLALRLHRGIKRAIPSPVMTAMLDARSTIHNYLRALKRTGNGTPARHQRGAGG